MRYKVGDKVQIKSWEELTKEFPVKNWEVFGDVINFPNGLAFSRKRYNIISEKCENRVDTIKEVVENMQWYQLKDSNSIVLDYVIRHEAVDTDMITDRFDILDL